MLPLYINLNSLVATERSVVVKFVFCSGRTRPPTLRGAVCDGTNEVSQSLRFHEYTKDLLQMD
jgi:hypothetical protein